MRVGPPATVDGSARDLTWEVRAAAPTAGGHADERAGARVTAGLTVDELAVGQRARWSKTLTEADVLAFAGTSGDMNPLHIDAVYAAGTKFGQRVVHGMLVASLISSLQARDLPGPGNLYVRQELRFVAPVFIGDTVTAEVEVVSLDQERNRVRMSTKCFKQDGSLVITGESELAPRPRPRGGVEPTKDGAGGSIR